MDRVRCCICRRKYGSPKRLCTHYLFEHSKCKIVKQLLKLSILLSTPKVLQRRCKYKPENKRPLKKSTKKIKMESLLRKTQTLYLNEDIHILCSRNEIIIGDSKSSVDLEFSFDHSSEVADNRFRPSSTSAPKCSRRMKGLKRKCNSYFARSSSASSEESNVRAKVAKRKRKRKKQASSRFRHYRINITKLRNQQSLDDQTGDFYICNCRKNDRKRIVGHSDLRIITSDTESCSDPGRNFLSPTVDTRVFCKQCGSGYKTDIELTEHMYIHEKFCRLCNISFPTEYSFREHMRLHVFKVFVCCICNAEFPFREMLCRHFECHIEEETFENILDMEEEYLTVRNELLTFSNYNISISNILYFLVDDQDFYYGNYRFMKILCDICWCEVYFRDYERHMQSVHYYFSG